MKLLNFYKEVKAEALRIVWPARKDTTIAVGLVFAMVVVFGVFFLLIDTVLYKLVKLVLG